MVEISNIIPITDLRHDAAQVMEKVRRTGEPLVITQRGRAAAVMLSVEAFEQREHDRKLLQLLAQGDKEAAATKGFDLDTVLKEADDLLREAS